MMENEKPTGAAAFNMNDFFTRQKANDGIQLPLYLPNGLKSDHWVRIIGIDSDIFRAADINARRDAVKIAQMENPQEREEAIAKSKRDLVAVLVTDWSFPTPCTHAAVSDFFKEAPQIMDAIDQAASRRALFFANGSSN